MKVKNLVLGLVFSQVLLIKAMSVYAIFSFILIIIKVLELVSNQFGEKEVTTADDNHTKRIRND